MNKIKIPKNWVLKYVEVEGNTTKFVYEDQLGIEHIYINEKPEPELPTYEELQKRLDFMIEQNDKKQEVLDKIKEYVKEWRESDGSEGYGTFELLELLEEIDG